jgi:hypothetical protein
MKGHVSQWNRIGGALLLCMASTTAVSAEAPKFDGGGWMVGNQQKNSSESLTSTCCPDKR